MRGSQNWLKTSSPYISEQEFISDVAVFKAHMPKAHSLNYTTMRSAFFFFNQRIADIQYCIGFWCKTVWFDIYLYFKMITTIRLVTFSHQSCCNIIDYVPYAAHHFALSSFFYNWKMVPRNPLHLFHPTPHPNPTAPLPWLLLVLICTLYAFLVRYSNCCTCFYLLIMISITLIMCN